MSLPHMEYTSFTTEGVRIDYHLSVLATNGYYQSWIETQMASYSTRLHYYFGEYILTTTKN